MPAVTDAAAEKAGGPDPALLRPIWSEDERIRLSGPPSALIGTVRLSRGPAPRHFPKAPENRSETRVGYRLRLARAAMVSTTLPTLPRRGHISLGSPIPPESTARVPISFSVPPATAPGTYEAVFEIGGEPRPAELEVLPDERLQIIAPAVSLAAAPGEVARGDLVFANQGNVPVTLDVLGGLILEDLEPLCLSLQRALAAVRDLPDEKDAHRAFLDRLVMDLAGKRADLGRARLADGPVTLEPGDSRLIPVEFHLPSNLVPGRRYKAMLACGTGRATVRFDAVAANGGRDRAVRKARAPRGAGKEAS